MKWFGLVTTSLSDKVVFSVSLRKLVRETTMEQIKTKTNKISKKCGKCEHVSEYPSNLKKHIMTHDANRIKFKCNYCEAELSSGKSLKGHTETIHFELKFPCHICDYETASQSSRQA